MINPIIKVLFKGYNNTLAGMVTRITTVIQTELAGQTTISAVLEKVSLLLVSLNNALGRTRKGTYTEALVIDDTDRDTLYRAWVLRLESDILLTYNPQIVANAKKLYGELVDNGKILKVGYLDESNQLENLFRRYESSTAQISENGIQELYSHLVAAQQKFQKTSSQSTQSATNQKEIPWIDKTASELINTLNDKLFTRINNSTEDIGEPFTTAAIQINEIIESTQRVQRSRLARNDSTDVPVEDKVPQNA